jgi:hypothetical protein
MWGNWVVLGPSGLGRPISGELASGCCPETTRVGCLVGPSSEELGSLQPARAGWRESFAYPLARKPEVVFAIAVTFLFLFEGTKYLVGWVGRRSSCGKCQA